MAQSFNCTMELGEIIKCGREIVASSGLFITKKRYATLIYDLEGKRVDQDGPGKVKAMGMDLKRSDTPVIMQDFLNILLLDVLTDVKEDEIIEKIKAFKFESVHMDNKNRHINHTSRNETIQQIHGEFCRLIPLQFYQVIIFANRCQISNVSIPDRR